MQVNVCLAMGVGEIAGRADVGCASRYASGSGLGFLAGAWADADGEWRAFRAACHGLAGGVAAAASCDDRPMV